MADLEFKIPEEILEAMPSGKEAMIRYLAQYFDRVVEKYETRLQGRATGIMGKPLSRYEKSMLKDFLIDTALGRLEELPRMAAESLTM
jgi:hypothetical protein